jgi:hypothetical protein
MYEEINIRSDEMAGNVIYMPDIEYKSWVNRNKELLDDIIKTGKVSTMWLAKGNNKSFLVRYFKECGYTITID